MKILLITLGLAVIALTTWQVNPWRKGYPRDPGPAVPAPNSSLVNPSIFAEGRVEFYPGARVTISSEVAGLLTNIVVQEKSRVQAGDLLAEIKADDIYASLMEARARVVEVESEIRLAQLEFERGKALATSSAITRQELDRLTLRLEYLQAHRTTCVVTVKRLETTLAKTRLCAPIQGVVLARHIHPGEVVSPGTPLVTLGDLQRTRIEAEVDEYDAGRVKLGAPVLIRAEGCSETWRGKVEEIPDAVNHRVLYPQDPARPSDVRVLLVKIAFEQSTPLKLGQRVEVEIR